jgi:hypothetical protein
VASRYGTFLCGKSLNEGRSPCNVTDRYQPFARKGCLHFERRGGVVKRGADLRRYGPLQEFCNLNPAWYVIILRSSRPKISPVNQKSKIHSYKDVSKKRNKVCFVYRAYYYEFKLSLSLCICWFNLKSREINCSQHN